MNKDDIDNRFAYHPAATEEKRADHSSIRGRCLDVATFINGLLPDGREKSLAITHIEEAMFWANAGIARPKIEELF